MLPSIMFGESRYYVVCGGSVTSRLTERAKLEERDDNHPELMRFVPMATQQGTIIIASDTPEEHDNAVKIPAAKMIKLAQDAGRYIDLDA